MKKVQKTLAVLLVSAMGVASLFLIEFHENLKKGILKKQQRLLKTRPQKGKRI